MPHPKTAPPSVCMLQSSCPARLGHANPREGGFSCRTHVGSRIPPGSVMPYPIASPTVAELVAECCHFGGGPNIWDEWTSILSRCRTLGLLRPLTHSDPNISRWNLKTILAPASRKTETRSKGVSVQLGDLQISRHSQPDCTQPAKVQSRKLTQERLCPKNH